MTQAAIRRWYLVHKWTSLIATLFLLLLCATGLPLIFMDEIDGWLTPPLPAVPAGARTPTIDDIVASARRAHPSEVPMFLNRDEDEPVYFISTATRPDETDDTRIHTDQYDARSGVRLDRPAINHSVMFTILRLHQGLLLGLPGTLFLGMMGVLLLASLVSGAVVYAPFMRKLAFGTVRKHRSRRIRWLDSHNMIGMTTMAWLTVVGATGVINTLAAPVETLWQNGQLAQMTAAYRHVPPPTRLTSVDAAVRTAQAAAPGMAVRFIAFPGTHFSSRHHYAIFLQGSTPLTARLVKPALVDAGTGRLTGIRELPLYAKALFLSEPLHYGDYGGLPLKIIWALLDIAAMAVLASGLYLWLGRRHVPAQTRLSEIRPAGLPEAEA